MSDCAISHCCWLWINARLSSRTADDCAEALMAARGIAFVRCLGRPPLELRSLIGLAFGYGESLRISSLQSIWPSAIAVKAGGTDSMQRERLSGRSQSS